MSVASHGTCVQAKWVKIVLSIHVKEHSEASKDDIPSRYCLSGVCTMTVVHFLASSRLQSKEIQIA